MLSTLKSRSRPGSWGHRKACRSPRRCRLPSRASLRPAGTTLRPGVRLLPLGQWDSGITVTTKGCSQSGGPSSPGLGAEAPGEGVPLCTQTERPEPQACVFRLPAHPWDGTSWPRLRGRERRAAAPGLGENQARQEAGPALLSRLSSLSACNDFSREPESVIFRGFAAPGRCPAWALQLGSHESWAWGSQPCILGQLSRVGPQGPQCGCSLRG